MYVLFAWGIVWRARIGESYQFENQLLGTVVQAGDGFAPGSISDWYDWVDGTLVQSVLPSTAPDGSELPPEALGRLSNGLGLIIGGVRLVQTRRAATPCPLGTGELSRLYGAVCYSDDTSLDSNFGNATAAAEYGVEGAFTASTVEGDGEGPKFQLFLNPQDGAETLSYLVNGLRASGWLDAGTQRVGVQIALLNGNVGLFGRVELTTTFTRGGLFDVGTTVQSVPVDPYYGAGENVLFDILFLLYWMYLLLGTARRLTKAMCGSEAPRYGSALSKLLAGLWNYWRLLDIATTLSLIITLGIWFDCVAKLSAIRNYIDNAEPTGPGEQ